MYQHVCTFKNRRKGCLTVQNENKDQHPEGNWSDYLKSHLALHAVCMSSYLKYRHCSSGPPIALSSLSLIASVLTCRMNVSSTAMQLFFLKSVRYKFTLFLKCSFRKKHTYILLCIMSTE